MDPATVNVLLSTAMGQQQFAQQPVARINPAPAATAFPQQGQNNIAAIRAEFKREIVNVRAEVRRLRGKIRALQNQQRRQHLSRSRSRQHRSRSRSPGRKRALEPVKAQK